MSSTKLFEYQEAGLDPIVHYAVPHHARSTTCDSVLEIDNLTGVQRGIGVQRAKAVVAVVQQSAGDLLMRGVLKGKLEGPVATMAAFGASIGSGHKRYEGQSCNQDA